MKTIIFISLPKPYLKEPEAQCPQGILALAAVLDQNKISCDVKNYSGFDSMEKAINNLPEAKCFGITATSLEILDANIFASLIKKKYPNSKVIIGGPGTLSEQYIDRSSIDSICKGEADYTILNIIEDLNKNKLKRVYIGETVKNLDQLPLLARNYVKDNLGGNIFAQGKNYTNNGSTAIMTSRGCAYNCSFCVSPALYKKCIRFRSSQNVYQEVKNIIDNYNIRQFRFSDDMFTVNRKRVIELCKLLKPLDIYWRVSSRVKPLDENLLKVMYDAGCREISFGIESFDDKILKILKKQNTVADNVKALELAAKTNLKARLLMMIRTPGQTPETIRLNKYYLKKVPYHIVVCTTFVPIPGSDIYNKPDKYDIEIINNNLRDYNFFLYGPNGKNKLMPIFKIKGRSVKAFHQETLEFRDWLEKNCRTNI